MPDLIVSTRNAHKLSEIADLLAPLEVCGLEALPELGEVEETGETFLENATLKALAASLLTPHRVLADDSGLEVEALGGDPGVRSARYAGEDADDPSNNWKLLAALAGKTDRAARFRCVMVIAQDGKILEAFSGEVTGEILNEPRGGAGFGYDPLFQPRGHAGSYAELGPEIKNATSHRARALAKVKNFLSQPEPALKK